MRTVVPFSPKPQKTKPPFDKRYLSLGIILFIIASGFIYMKNYDNSETGIHIRHLKQSKPKPIANVSFKDEKNNGHKLSHYKGDIILLHFWATWCQPCIKEIQELDQLQAEYQNQPFTILPISIDTTPIDTIIDFYQRYNITHLPVLQDFRNAAFNAAKAPLQQSALPYTVIINHEEKEVARATGALKWHQPRMKKLIDYYITNASSLDNSPK